jgi:hypothetical protein
VGSHYVGGREYLLAVASIVSGDLGSFGAAESATGYGLDDLLTARTRSIKILLSEAFDLRCATLARFDLIAEFAELIGEV